MPHNKIRGLTLIELIISIVILGIALGASISNMGALLKNSVDPLIRIQGYYLMKGYMDEITSKIPTVCDSTKPSPTRGNYVCNYNGMIETPTVPDGIVMDGKSTSTYPNFTLPNFAQYQISVEIDDEFEGESDKPTLKASTTSKNFLKVKVSGKYNNTINLGELITYLPIPK